MASISLSGGGNPASVAESIVAGVLNSAMSVNLVEHIRREANGVSFHLLVFDKYYMRNSSRASLTVTVFGSDASVAVDAVGSGGGQGALFKFDWGAGDQFVQVVQDVLQPLGFR